MSNFRKLLGLLLIAVVASAGPQPAAAQHYAASHASKPAVTLVLPNKEKSVKLAVFGDAGRGSREQYELGRVMDRFHQAFAFDAVLMTGDNIYYEDTPADMKKKFEEVGATVEIK